MTSLALTPAVTDRTMDHMDNLQPFFDAVRLTNPFIDNRVSGLSADAVDVDDIHRAAFERLTGLARQACEIRRGLGAVLWGEAGIGKSHLLARLAGWAEHDKQTCAVYLHNLQASPENLPRSILKQVVSVLTRGKLNGFSATPLFELVFAFVQEALHHDQTRLHPWKTVARAWTGLVNQLSTEDFARAAPVERTVFHVLFRYFHSVYRAPKTGDERLAALAVRWLSGDYLDPDQARELGLQPALALGFGQECSSYNPDVPVALLDNQQIKQVLVALSRMALSCHRPLLLCFDQVDNLDDEQAAALTRFLEAVIDSSPNLLVVTAGIQATLVRWHETKVIQDSAWDRLAQFQLPLQRLSPQECRHIVAARLEKAVTPFCEWEPLRALLDQDDLFPLGRAWAEEFFQGKIDLRPRDVINGGREAWQREQETLEKVGGPAWLEQWGLHTDHAGNGSAEELTEEQIRAAIDKNVEQRIAELCDQWRQSPDTLILDEDNLAGVVAALLQQVGGVDINRPPSGQPDKQFPFSVIVRRFLGEDGKVASTGLRFLVTDNPMSTTAALRRLTEADDNVERVLLVTEERSPLVFGAQANARGREYYAELGSRQPGSFKHITLTLAEHARLVALREVVGMARGGDLEIELAAVRSRQVSEHEVVESHRRQGRYLAAALLREILGAAEVGGC